MKAYLGWSVILKPPYSELNAHITLKYFGEVETLDYIDNRCPSDALKQLTSVLEARLKDAPERKFEITPSLLWEAREFANKTPVMAISNSNPALRRTRALLTDLGRKDFPTWNPHITLPRPVWTKISAGSLSFQDCVEAIGPLTLFVKVLPGEQYAADVTFP